MRIVCVRVVQRAFFRGEIHQSVVVALLLLVVATSGCWQAASPTVAPVPTVFNFPVPTKTNTLTPGPTSTETISPSPEPTRSLVPSATSTPAGQPTPFLSETATSAGKWELVWADEFDGDTVDTTRWKINRWKRAADVNKTWYVPENIAVSDGTLKLYVKNEVRGNANYTGGMIESTGQYQRSRYGYFEARIRYDFNGPGFWANFWMTGSDKWPPEFDNEVVTQLNHQNEIFQAHHYLDGEGTHVSSNAFIPANYREWHVYGIKWLPCQPVEFYLDGQRTFTSEATDDNPPGVDMDVVLRAGAYQTAKWGGLPDSTTQWPGVAEYDWVRVYRWAGDASTCSTP